MTYLRVSAYTLDCFYQTSPFLKFSVVLTGWAVSNQVDGHRVTVRRSVYNKKRRVSKSDDQKDSYPVSIYDFGMREDWIRDRLRPAGFHGKREGKKARVSSYSRIQSPLNSLNRK